MRSNAVATRRPGTSASSASSLGGRHGTASGEEEDSVVTAWVVEVADLRSTNGSFVNGVLIPAGSDRRSRLRDGDTLTLGTAASQRSDRASDVVYRLELPPPSVGGGGDDDGLGGGFARAVLPPRRESVSREALIRKKKRGDVPDDERHER